MEWTDLILTLSPLVLAATVFSASLLGSLHCAGMCGPLQATVAPTRWASMIYHAGRILSYSALGAAAGFFGDSVFSDSTSIALAWISGSMFALTLFAFGLSLFMSDRAFHFPFQSRFSSKVFKKIFGIKALGLRSFSLGLMTPLLPCGWLLSFCMGAALTESPYLGALVMFSFCIGTLPVLGVIPFAKRAFIPNFSVRSRRFAGGLFALAAIGIVVVRVASAYQQLTCH